MGRSVEHELCTHTRSLRALARALVGAQDADDLLQQAAVEALEPARVRPHRLGAWLARVLRHLAAKQRRAAHRRQTHEQRAAEPAAPPAPERVAAHRECLQRLTAALTGMPEPYQGTLLLRYFEDLSPRAIAAQTGVPVATVKSRLQRGLTMLRAQLDAGGGGDWRPALALAFGLERGTGVAGALSLVATGVLFMNTISKLVLASAAVLLAVGASWFLFGGGIEGPGAGSHPDQPAAHAVAADARELPPTIDGETPSRTLALPAASAGVATIQGRCVDELGKPLDGVTARVSVQVQDGGAPPPHRWREQPAQRTGNDGRFALPVAAAADLIEVEVAAERRCPCRGRWRALASGEVVDLGDVVVPTGVMVRGRVVDTAGQPVAGVQVNACRDRMANAKELLLGPQLECAVTTDARGAFTAGPLPPGRGSVRISERWLAPGVRTDFVLDAGRREVTVDLVVLSDTELPPILGEVVAESGLPVAGAWVDLQLSDNANARTDAAGKFTLRPGGRGPLPATFGLVASADGFELAVSGPHRFGTPPLRIVLRRAGEVVVRVREAGTGVPVHRFALEVLRAPPGLDSVASVPCRVWPDGLGRAGGVTPGQHRVYVDPGDGVLAPSSFVPVTAPGEVEVLLTRLGARPLILQTAAGEPAAHARVELLDPFGQPIALDSEVFTVADWGKLRGPSKLILLQDGKTDANGEVLLRGPLGRDLALRLRGPGIALQTLAPVRLDGDTPLRATATRGATWTGRLVPADVAAALFAGSQTRGNEQPARRAFGLELWRPRNEKLTRYLEPLVPYAADGSFRVEGIPAGTWGVTVFGLGAQYPAAAIEVREGESLARDLDVAAMRPIEVELQVLVDGAPLVHSLVQVSVEHGRGHGGRAFRSGASRDSDATGCVRLTTFAGRLGCDLYLRGGGVVSTPAIDVTGSGRQVLDVRVGRLKLRVLQPDGQPAAALPLALASGVHRQSEQTTDAGGRAAWPCLPHAAFVVRARPRSLRDEAGRGAHAQIHGWEATHAAWLDVGHVTLGPASGDGEVEVRLPPEWER